jgi:hypothetical protein
MASRNVRKPWIALAIRWLSRAAAVAMGLAAGACAASRLGESAEPRPLCLPYEGRYAMFGLRGEVLDALDPRPNPDDPEPWVAVDSAARRLRATLGLRAPLGEGDVQVVGDLATCRRVIAALRVHRAAANMAPVTTDSTRVLVVRVRDRAFAALDPEDRAGEWRKWWLLARDLRVVESFGF